MAPLIFFTGQMRNLGASFGHRDFMDDSSSSLNFISDSRKLNALHQEPGILLKEPIGIIYRDENDTSVSYQSSDKEQSIPIENASRKERILEQNTSEIENREIVSILQENETENVALRAEDNTNQELQEVTKPRKISLGGSEKLTAENQIIQKVIPDVRVRQMRDQLIRARVYLNLAPIRNNAHYVRELRQRMKELQRSLGEASKDSDLPRSAGDRMKTMEQTLAKGKQLYDDCSAAVKKLRAMVHSTEELLRAHKKQNTYLTQLAAKTLPKGLHCLSMRLTTDYHALTSSEQDFPNKEKLDDKNLYHYAIFSDNILAVAVVVNSTVFHAKEPEKHVFHVVTDKLNYPAIKMWFLANLPGKATIQIQTVDEFTWLNSSYSPVLRQLGSASMKEYYFRIHHSNADSNLKYRNPKYLSILNHLRFYLPEIFPNLNKVLFLDDDIVVQKDLTALWEIDMQGKVIGAVETCGESFHRFDKYLNFSNLLIARNFDPNACGWAYGMNIFDLEEWKKQNITGIYHRWQRLNKDRQLWKLGTLPPGLITFYNLTFILNKSWHVLGLGYNPNLGSAEIERAAVIHYNGNMKPWLEIAIAKYKHYWTKYVKYDHIFLQLCNISE
ncbi:hypothetical protein KI387_027211 [Taxus chinensis]|uniref:Hexosyltransferase n=1 Tax=Taxus chinensis TaxID=29808 RepID=A0AA38FXZ1_TAXCH|nr:hypothetical protein KI387_027211 [Taxus chinensis]